MAGLVEGRGRVTVEKSRQKEGGGREKEGGRSDHGELKGKKVER